MSAVIYISLIIGIVTLLAILGAVFYFQYWPIPSSETNEIRPIPPGTHEVKEQTAVAPPQNRKAIDYRAKLDTSLIWRILVIDDIPTWGSLMQRFGTVLNCEVRHVTNLTLAEREVIRWSPNLILLDWHLPRDPWQPRADLISVYRPDQKSVTFCRQITSDPTLADTLVVFTSVEDQQEEIATAMSAGAFAFYSKEEFSVELMSQLLLYLQDNRPNPQSPHA